MPGARRAKSGHGESGATLVRLGRGLDSPVLPQQHFRFRYCGGYADKKNSDAEAQVTHKKIFSAEDVSSVVEYVPRGSLSQHLRVVYHAPNTDAVVAVRPEAETKKGTIRAAISVN